MTASGHESNLGDRVTVTSHSDLPDELGNTHADDVISSSSKNTTGHAESGLGETGIDPRIVTGFPENKSVNAESGSGQTTAIDLDVIAHGNIATATMTASDALYP